MMNAYELMIQTNHFLVKGGVLSDKQKQNITAQFLDVRSFKERAKRFSNGGQYPKNTDKNKRELYPIFFIPPYHDGKKLKTILNQTPKTKILSANMYELEILRLLYLFAPENDDVKLMTSETLRRLQTTCFGYQDDGLGECFDTSLIVLRFISTVTPNDEKWIKSRIDNYNHHVNEKKRPWFCLWYFWLCLSEMPFAIAESEIEKYKEIILNWLYTKSYVMNSEHDKMIHPVLLAMLRNIMAKYPEFAYIKDREPYVSDKDGRLHFDMS